MTPDTKILLTGATGGIGRATALRLASAGAELALVGRDPDSLAILRSEVEQRGARATVLRADLTEDPAVRSLGDRALEALGGLDVVIHAAGLCSFAPADRESAETVERLFQVNTVAPIQITESLLPHFKRQGCGTIVNIGSIFGSIGFAHFAAYSATKFALRGWSEALRRELDGSGVRVLYVAPRATRTPMAHSFAEMAEAVGMKLDPPEHVAEQIDRALTSGAKERYVGFPERFFVRVNAVLPRLVDRALRGQDRKAGEFARRAASENELPAA